jgi:hypothetical protein
MEVRMKYLSSPGKCQIKGHEEGCFNIRTLIEACFDSVEQIMSCHGGRWPVHVEDNEELTAAYLPESEDGNSDTAELLVERMACKLSCYGQFRALAEALQAEQGAMNALQQALAGMGIFVTFNADAPEGASVIQDGKSKLVVH